MFRKETLNDFWESIDGWKGNVSNRFSDTFLTSTQDILPKEGKAVDAYEKNRVNVEK